MQDVSEHFERSEDLASLAENGVFVEQVIAAEASPLLVSLKDVHELDWLSVLSKIVQHQLAVVIEQSFEFVIHRLSELKSDRNVFKIDLWLELQCQLAMLVFNQLSHKDDLVVMMGFETPYVDLVVVELLDLGGDAVLDVRDLLILFLEKTRQLLLTLLFIIVHLHP
jgi:hypothetical protein